MASGTYTPGVSKIRPGTYINVTAQPTSAIGGAARGTVLLPLFDHDWTLANDFFTIERNAPDAQWAKLGHKMADAATNTCVLKVREALKNAVKVIVVTPATGTKATLTVGGLTLTAKRGGTRGNTLKAAITVNVANSTKFDFTLYLGDTILSAAIGAATCGDVNTALANNGWVDIAYASGSDEDTALSAVALSAFTGGAAPTLSSSDIANTLNLFDSQIFDVLAFCYSGETYSSYQASVKSKVVELHDTAGKRVHCVTANYAADSEYIDNVTNGVILSDGTTVSADVAAAYLAGLSASASYITSNTNAAYVDAVKLNTGKTAEAAATATTNGEQFFEYDPSGVVVLENDINSLTTITNKSASYKKNRVIRTIDAFANACASKFRPNKFNNDADGWTVVESLGKALLTEFANAHAITNVDTSTDFRVDRAASSGDNLFLIIGIQPVDSAEKIYIDIRTR